MHFLGVPESTPSFYHPESAWLRHGPFGMWLVRALEPRQIVELGTHHGFSYFCFCQAVADAGLSTRCFAVDTWEGDEHAGRYGDSILRDVQLQNARYSDFSTLLRKTFAEALNDVEDGSIDLLHVDGRHYYEDVKEDFESWIPKLSERAVVLFHDTEVRERNFGVWRYWAEISTRRPSLNFQHEHGLGVLFWGNEIADGLAPLMSLIAEPSAGSIVYDHFETRGVTFANNTATIRALRTEPQAARRYSLNQLKRKIMFKGLRALAKASPPLSPRTVERLRLSAAKRDPDRDD